MYRAIETLGYQSPSPIQAQMIPHLLEGHDAIGIAQTGTGKTAAFLLPLLTMLSRIKERPTKGKCDVLVLTPTRELASQILENARLYGQYVKFASALIVGGARYEGQLRALARGVNLIVATPGRLIDHIESGAVSLAQVRYVVLDEADQMLDMGFVPAIRQIMATVPDERQTILTSATMPRPIEKLASELLKNPKRIAVSRESEPAKNVKQEIIFVDKPQKPAELKRILDETDWSKVIIFTRTKRGADKVQVQLIKSGHFAQSLHGDKSFGQRRHIMEEFKSGEVTILVATDLAGRGLDISDISLVINYDIPNIAESYVHRIGRTGRAGRKGLAISLVDRSEKSYLKDIEALMGISLRGDASTVAPLAKKSAGNGQARKNKDKKQDDDKSYSGPKKRRSDSKARQDSKPKRLAPSDAPRRDKKAKSDRPQRKEKKNLNVIDDILKNFEAQIDKNDKSSASDKSSKRTSHKESANKASEHKRPKQRKARDDRPNANRQKAGEGRLKRGLSAKPGKKPARKSGGALAKHRKKAR